MIKTCQIYVLTDKAIVVTVHKTVPGIRKSFDPKTTVQKTDYDGRLPELIRLALDSVKEGVPLDAPSGEPVEKVAGCKSWKDFTRKATLFSVQESTEGLKVTQYRVEKDSYLPVNPGSPTTIGGVVELIQGV